MAVKHQCLYNYIVYYNICITKLSTYVCITTLSTNVSITSLLMSTRVYVTTVSNVCITTLSTIASV